MPIEKKYYLISILFTVCFNTIYSQSISVHDPVMIEEDSTYYIFCTGYGISVYSSRDLIKWDSLPPVFEKAPDWASKKVIGFKGHIWAPDISYHNNQYYLYYSISSFAKNNSCIGLATNCTLNPKDPKYKWTDRGIVIQSVPGRDLWNAIDPNLIFDEHDIPWLAFGSFWSGIKLTRLDSSLCRLNDPQEWYSIAKRQREYTVDDIYPGSGAIEAPYIFKKDKYYYLFISLDYCCRGINSDYKIAVGRSQKIEGPYYDRNGISLNHNGGTIIQQRNNIYSGMGHNSVLTLNDIDYIIYHAYNYAINGRPELVIKKIIWDDEGWPKLSE